MANQLSIAEVNSVETHRKTGTSRREIARLLGLHRETVGKCTSRRRSGGRRWRGNTGQTRPPGPSRLAMPLAGGVRQGNWGQF